MNRNKESTAFPISVYGYLVGGLSKREYFAAIAMQGLLSNQSLIDAHDKNTIEWIANHALEQADAILDKLV